MRNLEIEYLGLSLKNPLIVGSCGLTFSAENILEFEKAGAAAVVIKSLYEEQIMHEADSIAKSSDFDETAHEYIQYYLEQNSFKEYLNLISQVKEKCSIPVIASINCASKTDWVEYAELFEKAGADALELNMFIMPSNPKETGAEVEEKYFEIIRAVEKKISIPLSLKVSYFFSSLANMLVRFSQNNIDGLVLFNRLFSPDFDLETNTVVPAQIYSNPEELATPLRWISILSNQVECDIAASTGVHDGKGLIKSLLAGATAAQMVSAIYKNGPAHITATLKELDEWMGANHYKTISDFRGKMSQAQLLSPGTIERAHFMKYFSGHQVD